MILVPQTECLRIVDEIMNELDLGEFEIRINHRLLLEGMFSVCGIKDADFKTVCSSVDKLDKAPWDEVAAELMNEKKIDKDAVGKLERYFRLRERNSQLGNEGLLNALLEDEALSGNKNSVTAIKEIKLLLEYLELFGAIRNVAFETSLARGLEYYTGAIYEVVIKEFSFSGLNSSSSSNPDDRVTVGSVAAGGRYDKLVGSFLGGKGKSNVPCVGISFGIERLFSIMEAKHAVENSPARLNATQVYVSSAQKGLLKARMKIIRLLWDAGFKAEMSFKANPKMLDQLQYCEGNSVPWIVIIGERELEQGVVKLREISTRTETDIPVDELTTKLAELLK
jgi:histidyl-tRNA synthetase